MCGTCGDKNHDDLNDDLDMMMFGTEAHMFATFRADFELSGEKKPGYEADADPLLADVAMHYEPCRKCNGSGVFRSYTGRIVGNCYTCKGTKQIAFKTSTEDRAAARQSKLDAKQEAVRVWMEANKAEWDWLVANWGNPRWEFPRSMMEALTKYGFLTERQTLAIQTCIAKDTQRGVEAQQRVATAKVVDVSVIENSFARAMERGVKSPKLRLDGFKFSRAKDDSANAGSLYVKDIESDEYLGKITGGKFLRVRSCTAEQEARIIAAAADPAAAAKAYGQRTGTCSVCGRLLTKGESVDRAIGPICAENFGW